MRNSDFKNYAQRARRGFTLVEVMVALAIFVFGAMAILRIFPGALVAVRETEDRATANRMSRARLAGFESRQLYPPDAVYVADPSITDTNFINPGRWKEAVIAGNQPLTYVGGIANNSLPAGPEELGNPITNTTLGTYKQIVGEKQQVREQSGGGNFVLTSFPILGQIQSRVRVYREEIVTGVVLTSTGNLDFSQAQTPTIPNFGGTNGRPVNHRFDFVGPETVGNTTFYVTYRYGTNPQQTSTDEPVRVPLDTAVTWDPSLHNRVTQTPVIPGPVTVRYRQLIFSSSLPTTDARVGLVRLPSSGISPRSYVSVDYTVSDWRELLRDETLTQPAGGGTANQFQIAAPMQFIDVEKPIYTLFQSPETPAPTPPSRPYQLRATQWQGGAEIPAPTAGTPRFVELRASSGQIIYEAPVRNTIARTIYNTTDGWAHQLAVSARTYMPHHVPTRFNPREPWREYFGVVPATAGQGYRLYFQASEAGKTLLVSYRYQDGARIRSMSAVLLPVSSDLTTSGAMPANFTAPNATPTSGQLSFVELINHQGTPLAQTLIGLDEVRGGSVMARTAWVRGTRYSQVVARGIRPMTQTQ
jgi:prepilin-type N-terminal cleavage/methylation domain-containing protein